MKKIALSLSFLCIFGFSFAQKSDKQETINKIYSEVLQNGRSYEDLRVLCKQIGGRLSGSPQAAAAVEYCRDLMEKTGLDTVWLQPVMVPHWVRGNFEEGRILSTRRGAIDVPLTALGNAYGTGPVGLSAELVEITDFEQLKLLGEAKIKGRIVFFNIPMDATLFSTFQAYGKAGRQRGSGPSEAAKYGAIGAITRSLASNIDDIPHTGATNYALNVPKIPAAAISTRAAELLSDMLKEEPDLKFFFRTDCKMLEDAPSFNVIGELRGTEKPEEIIVVGGHLDSWDTGEGAHDDGAGCMQSIEVLRTFISLKIKPKRTIRAVMFMNEENGLAGGLAYAAAAVKAGEKHIAALESDRGGFTPRAFGIGTESEAKFLKIKAWEPLFKDWGISEIRKGGGGADISPMRRSGTLMSGYIPDSQRYFNYHHTAADVFEAVDERELKLGAAAMTGLIWLFSETDWNE